MDVLRLNVPAVGEIAVTMTSVTVAAALFRLGVISAWTQGGNVPVNVPVPLFASVQPRIGLEPVWVLSTAPAPPMPNVEGHRIAWRGKPETSVVEWSLSARAMIVP